MIPVSISPERKIIVVTIPKTGTIMAETRMNPTAEPARSALYTDDDNDPSLSCIVRILNR